MVKPFTRFGAIVAIACASAVSVRADIIEIGYFYNAGRGEIHYEGNFRDHVTSQEQGDNGQYTKIDLDITGILTSIDAGGFRAIMVDDTGENAYGSAPGADIDLFRIHGLSAGNGYTFAYDGPTETHRSEAADILHQRVNELDWGTNGRGLPAMTFVSLGRDGVLTAALDRDQIIDPGGNGLGSDIVMEIAEAGTNERFRIYIETVAVPAPGAAALFVLILGRGQRRRR